MKSRRRNGAPASQGDLVQNEGRPGGGVVEEEEGRDQICVEIDEDEARTSIHLSEKDDQDSGAGGKVPVLLLLSIIKLVDLSFHGVMLGLFLYSSYLSALYCTQVQLEETTKFISISTFYFYIKSNGRRPYLLWKTTIFFGICLRVSIFLYIN